MQATDPNNAMNQHNNNQSPLQSTFKQIQYSLQQRLQIINNYTTKLSNYNTTNSNNNTINNNKNTPINLYLQTQHKNNIINYCNKYIQVNPLFQQLLQQQQQLQNGNKIHRTKNQQFWSQNQHLQRILQQQLRKLKDIDIQIDNLVNQQFDKCNQIDQIQQTIRIILHQKQNGHIKKAEPYYQIKKQFMGYLRNKAQEKQQVKDKKLKNVVGILGLLNQLRVNRQQGLKYCSSQLIINVKDKKYSQEQSKNLINQTINQLKNNIVDLQKLINNPENKTIVIKLSPKCYQTTKNNQLAISITTLHIVKTKRNMLEYVENMEEKKLNVIFWECFYGSNWVEEAIKQKDQLLDNHREKYQQEQIDKKKNIQKIKQGISTTQKTIQIFQHIFQKIQSENIRRKQLLGNISQIQKWHIQQNGSREIITEMESETDKLIMKRNRLEKTLANKIDEADVTAYKSIHRDIEIVEEAIKTKQKQIEGVKIKISQNAQSLYDETMNLQEQFSDILSEVVPNYWFRDNDFTKEESIKDLNLYLMKTFKRLSIAD